VPRPTYAHRSHLALFLYLTISTPPASAFSPSPDVTATQEELGLVTVLCIQSALANSSFSSYRSSWHTFFRFSLGLQLDSPPTSPEISCPICDLALPYWLRLLHHPLLYLLSPLFIDWGWSRDLDSSSKFPGLGTLPQRNLP
jgi:hypothetical protein